MPSDIFLWSMVRQVLAKSTEYPHNIRFVHGSDTLPAVSLGVIEGIARYAFRSIPGDQLD